MTRRIETVAIIGARGGMGQLYCSRRRRAGIEVIELDRPITDEMLAGAIPRADCVVLSIPVAAMADISRRVGAFMRAPQILVDLCSVKIQPLADMRAGYAGPIVATHPLFGPGTADGDDARVAIMPGMEDSEADAEALESIWDWTGRMGFVPFRTTPEEHDKAMAYFQGLNFVTTVAYLAVHGESSELAPFVTPSFRRRLDAAKKLLLEDAGLFTALFEANPFSQDIVRIYRNYLNVAAGGDVDLLVQRASRWWTMGKEDSTHE